MVDNLHLDRPKVLVMTTVPLRPTAVESTDSNLTQFEFLALNSALNLADGHARQELTDGQALVVEDLPSMWAASMKRPVEEVERDAQRAYLEMLGQHGHPVDEGRVLSCYSSSVAMEILARSLATRTDAVALIHPTFDNIPDILRGVGLRLVPVPENAMHAADDLDAELMGAVGCLFVTTPNNPTGRVLSESRLRRLAAQCADHDVVLALDTSFRGFDPAAHYDHYAVLEASGCRWVVIEDTGKLWPTLELKVGMLVPSVGVGLPLAKIYSDILLGVSPLVLSMIERLSADAAAGGLARLHAFIAGNQTVVRDVLSDVPGVRFCDPGSKVSVERVHVGELAAMRVWAELARRHVFLLPCRRFHWADPAQGDHTLRIALSRPRATVTAGAEALRAVLLTDR